MLMAKGVPHEEIIGIEVGDFIYESEIVTLWNFGHYLKVKTADGLFYTLHRKADGYNVFKFTKGSHFNRDAKREAKRLERKRRKMETAGERFVEEKRYLGKKLPLEEDDEAP